MQRGRKIPFLTFTEERSFPEDYDYTRVLDYFSDEDRDASSHDEEEEEEEEVGDVSDADASDDRGSDDDYVGGGDGDDDGDSSDDDDDDGIDFGYREDRELEKERRGKQVRRAAQGGSREAGVHVLGVVLVAKVVWGGGGGRGGRKRSARASRRGAGRGEGNGSDGNIPGGDDEWVNDDTVPQEMEFTGNPGITSARPTSALGFIQLFFTRALLNYLTEETNMYAMYCWDVLKINNALNWQGCSVGDIAHYLGL